MKMLSGEVVCFTGKCLYGERKEVEALAKRNDAIVTDRVGSYTTMLVVGTLGSKCWISPTGGRKIHAAEGRYGLDFKNKPKIISEKDFLERLGIQLPD